MKPADDDAIERILDDADEDDYRRTVIAVGFDDPSTADEIVQRALYPNAQPTRRN